MLRERIGSGGVPVLESAVLVGAGFAHAFSTRLGGVSAPPFGSLNLQSQQANARARAAGGAHDEDANLVENLARFLEAAGMSRDATVADASQVHGCAVVDALAARATRCEADAITSTPGGPAVLVRIADCVPVLLADPRTGSVAAVHAGWRGVVAGIVARAVEALRAAGARPEDLVAAVGPCISARHFEIGPEVADALALANLASCVRTPGVHGPRHHADLVEAVRAQLV
ncbi:MAG: hypothetical protein RI967_1001, partial [Planctomycetota bacterium]